MYFTPPEEPDIDSGQDSSSNATDELLREMGEIGRDYAAMAVQLEAISGSLSDLVDRQDGIVNSMRASVDAAVSAVSPNPELLESMKSTTGALDRFAVSVEALSERLQVVERQEVERLVRVELEKILSRKILKTDESSPAPPSTD